MLCLMADFNASDISRAFVMLLLTSHLGVSAVCAPCSLHTQGSRVLCHPTYLHSHNFLCSHEIWKLDDSGPIDLSVMVVLSDCFLEMFEERSIAIALTLHTTPKTWKRCFDDSHAKFQNKAQSLTFLDVLNTQDPAIQYTIEFENKCKQLYFLDGATKINESNFYDFQFFAKLPSLIFK